MMLCAACGSDTGMRSQKLRSAVCSRVCAQQAASKFVLLGPEAPEIAVLKACPAMAALSSGYAHHTADDLRLDSGHYSVRRSLASALQQHVSSELSAGRSVLPVGNGPDDVAQASPLEAATIRAPGAASSASSPASASDLDLDQSLEQARARMHTAWLAATAPASAASSGAQRKPGPSDFLNPELGGRLPKEIADLIVTASLTNATEAELYRMLLSQFYKPAVDRLKHSLAVGFTAPTVIAIFQMTSDIALHLVRQVQAERLQRIKDGALTALQVVDIGVKDCVTVLSLWTDPPAFIAAEPTRAARDTRIFLVVMDVVAQMAKLSPTGSATFMRSLLQKLVVEAEGVRAAFLERAPGLPPRSLYNDVHEILCAISLPALVALYVLPREGDGSQIEIHDFSIPERTNVEVRYGYVCLKFLRILGDPLLRTGLAAGSLSKKLVNTESSFGVYSIVGRKILKIATRNIILLLPSSHSSVRAWLTDKLNASLQPQFHAVAYTKRVREHEYVFDPDDSGFFVSIDSPDDGFYYAILAYYELAKWLKRNFELASPNAVEIALYNASRYAAIGPNVWEL
jgi:hypothetical protein